MQNHRNIAYVGGVSREASDALILYSRPMFKAVLFDFDGTIVNSLPDILETWKEAFHDQGVPLTDKEAVTEVFYTSQAEREARFGIDADKAELEHQSLLNPRRETYPLQEGVAEVITELHARGVKLAIVSSTYAPAITQVLDDHDLTRYFDVILGGDAGLPQKPDPAVALRAMELLGVEREETLLVGDSPVDMLTGQRAGVKVALYAPEDNAPYRDEATLMSLVIDYRFTRYADFFSTIGTPDPSTQG